MELKTAKLMASDHVMAVNILCRTMIHLAYLSLAVSAAIHGRNFGAACLVFASLIVPIIVARIPQPKAAKPSRRPVTQKEQ